MKRATERNRAFSRRASSLPDQFARKGREREAGIDGVGLGDHQVRAREPGPGPARPRGVELLLERRFESGHGVGGPSLVGVVADPDDTSALLTGPILYRATMQGGDVSHEFIDRI